MPASIPAPIAGLSFGYRFDCASGDVLRPGEVFFVLDGTGGSVTLPPASSTGGALVLCIAPADGGVLRIRAAARDTIDGDASYNLLLPQRSQMLVSLGVLNEWKKL